MSTTSWPQIEKLALTYLKKSDAKSLAALDKSLQQTGEFAKQLASFCVTPWPELEKSELKFSLSEDGMYPEWSCRFNKELNTFFINVVGVLRYAKECRQCIELAEQPETRLNFSNYRLCSYKAQLSKLPTQMLMFLLLYQEEARVMDVAKGERKRDKATIFSQDLDYTYFLWGFRELEKLYRCLKGVDLTSDLHFVWHKNQWANGGK